MPHSKLRRWRVASLLMAGALMATPTLLSADSKGDRAIASTPSKTRAEADAMAADRLQLLDVHHEAAVALDQQHLAVAARGRHADRRRKGRTDRAEVVEHVHVLRVAAVEMRDRDAGEVRIFMARRDDLVELRVEDDGIGWSGTGKPQGTGLGSRIVKAMAHSLGAEVGYDNEGGGTRVTVTFSA